MVPHSVVLENPRPWHQQAAFKPRAGCILHLLVLASGQVCRLPHIRGHILSHVLQSFRPPISQNYGFSAQALEEQTGNLDRFA